MHGRKAPAKQAKRQRLQTALRHPQLSSSPTQQQQHQQQQVSVERKFRTLVISSCCYSLQVAKETAGIIHLASHIRYLVVYQDTRY